MDLNKLNVDPESACIINTLTPEARSLPFFCLQCGTFYCKSGFSFTPNVSTGHFIIYTFYGSGFLCQGSAMMKLGSGSCAIIDCSTPLRFEQMPGGDAWHFRWCIVDGIGVEQLLPRINTKNISCPTPVTIDVVRTEKDMDRIQLLCGRNSQNDDLAICVRIHSILFSMCQARTKEAPTDNIRRDDIFAAAYYMQLNFAKKIDIAKLSSEFCMSKFYFVRLFKKYIGTTPYDFLLLYRIERAKELLISTGHNIRTICEMVGFGSESNFSVRFTKVVGMSPSDFRKNNYRQKAQPPADPEAKDV